MKINKAIVGVVSAVDAFNRITDVWKMRMKQLEYI